MHLPTPGMLFQRKYEILQPLGTGGFATVFLAHDSEIRRDVAIKVLAPMDGGYPSTVVARFMVEARVIARLRDAHTIRLFEFGESEDGLLYMVFQYVEGADLGAVLAGRGALPPEVAVHIAVQVLRALAEAHAIGVFHRDIKPANILVHHYMGDDYAVKLLDFGIAKIDEDRAGLTKTGTMVGTPRYMSPEQVFGEPVTAASDIYSLGVVIYEMLAGQPAIVGDRKEILARHAEQIQHEVPRSIGWPALRAVVDRMMARDPRARHTAASEAIAALEQAMRERSSGGQTPRLAPPIPPPTDEVTTPLARPVAPQSTTARKGGWHVLVAALVVSLGVGIVALVLTERAGSPPDADQHPSLPDELLSAPAPPQPELARSPDVASRDSGHADDPASGEELADGCGNAYPKTEERRLTIGPGRTALVYLPDDYDPHRRYPIILGLGPKYRTDVSFAKDARLTMLGAEPVIVIVVMPEDRFTSWEYPQDIEVVRHSLDAVEAAFCVDRRRVFGAGYHDGSKFLRELVCRVPLAGIALAGFAEKAGQHQYCEIKPAVPTLWVLGTEDDFIPLEGGQGCTSGVYHRAESHDEIWRRRNACDATPRVLSKTSTSVCRVWSCRAAYASCRADGGHYLSATDWALLFPFCAKRDLEFDLAAEAWNFFQKHGVEIDDDDPRHAAP